MFEAGKTYSLCVDCVREGVPDASTSDTLYLVAQKAIRSNYDGKVRCNKHLRENLFIIKSDLQRQIAEIDKFASTIKD